ncbi:MAG: glycosyltransferase family 4 protein [Elusimicrobiota bacterium]|jgi:glycosyltransferase involved in cell wall biosynthesis
MTKKPRLLVLAPRMPFPPVSGGERWIAAVLQGLRERFDVSVLAFFSEGLEARQAATALQLEHAGFRRMLCLPAPPPAADAGLPLNARVFRSEEARRALARLVREDGVDLVHAFFLETAQYVEDLPPGLPVVLTEIDASHFRSRGSYLRGDGGAADEAELYRAYARRFFPRGDALTALCAEDARILRRLLPGTPVSVVGLSTEVPAEVPPRPKGGAELVFVGNYLHFPNEDAAVHLCRDILPLLRARAPEVRVSLVGACPTPAVRALASETVSVTGPVPSVRPWLERAAVFVAPVRIGGGTKCKVLEAFAHGVPVVATPRVLAGMDAPGAREAMITADGPEAFAAATLRLLRDPELRARFSERGRRLAEERFDDRRAVSDFSALYDGLLARAGSPRR